MAKVRSLERGLPQVAVDRAGRARSELVDVDLEAAVRGIVGLRPAVGLALGVVEGGRPTFVGSHGLADIASRTPVTQDTVFRIASITKLFTAVAVLQLVERGVIDLDSPASDHLRAYALAPARRHFRPATVRHLLTHTAGIPEVVHLADLLHPGWGPFGARPAESSVPIGERLPSLAEYYRGGLRITVEPGTTFQYTNHGFATLGQIIEDVSGIPLARYFRERILGPLGMESTDLVRSERIAARLATGYSIGGRGPARVPDRDWVCVAGGGMYSTAADMARFVAALTGGGANEHGRILEPATLATMFAPHWQPDPRLPGRGLGFARADDGGYLIVSHSGVLPGFDSELLVAPDAGVGVFAFTNGSSGAFVWLGIELDRLLRQLLGVPDTTDQTDIPDHPEIWSELCGRYRLPAGTDLRGRVALGAGAQVFVRSGRLMVRILTPVPALLRGLPLRPDDRDDPRVFRLDLSSFGMPSVRVVFQRDADRARAVHVDLPGQPLSLYRARTPEVVGTAALAFGAVASATAAAAVVRRRRGTSRREAP
jgi:CubicO group peptidase (beta-lactamase class C family)